MEASIIPPNQKYTRNTHRLSKRILHSIYIHFALGCRQRCRLFLWLLLLLLFFQRLETLKVTSLSNTFIDFTRSVLFDYLL